MSEPPPVFVCVDDRGSLWRYRKESDCWAKERVVYAEWRINDYINDQMAAEAFAETVEVYVPVEREERS